MKRFPLLLLIFLYLLSMSSHAAIVMVGTRIIYNAKDQEVTLQVSNTGDAPVVVQSWLDAGNEQSSPDTTDAPFFVTPPITKIMPREGQSLRVVFTGDATAFPEDRESVFYFNLLEIPSLRDEQVKQNKLVLLTKHRLKVFYRPEGLSGNPADDVLERLLVTRRCDEQGQTVIALHNPTAYHASFRDAVVKVHGRSVALKEVNMIPPFSSAHWVVTEEALGYSPELHLTLVNDHGGNQTRIVEL